MGYDSAVPVGTCTVSNLYPAVSFAGSGQALPGYFQVPLPGACVTTTLTQPERRHPEFPS